MANLINTWVGYFDRSYQQGKEAILTRLGITTPEMSDHTESNPYIWIVDIFLGISELLHYYIDNAAREVFLHSARQYKSGQKIAKLFNYRLKGYSASSGIVRFYIETAAPVDINIPVGTVVLAGDVEFRTTASVVLLAGELFVEVLAIQRTPATASYTSDGNPSQKVVLEDNAVDKSVTITVDNITYSFVDNFLLSTPTSLHFTTEIGTDQKFYVVFGDGVNGIIPILNADIVINYFTSVGADGNVASGEIDTVETMIVAPAAVLVTNPTYTTGGAGIETLKSLKRTIPASIRTLNRAVTEQDFKDIAESATGVEKAFVDYHCGASVDIYIVPTGTGGATQVLMDSVKDLFYDETRLIMMEVVIKPAGRIMAKIEATVKVLDVYNRTLVTQAVKDNLKAFFSSENQEISGSVYVGDIYQVIENTEGVSHCELQLISTIPEATIVNGTSVLSWTRTLMPASVATQSWSIKFIGSNQYELRKGSSYLGTFSLGITLSLPEIEFMIIDAGYSAGDLWEFSTYRYNGTLELNEPSILTIDDANINLTVTGGV